MDNIAHGGGTINGLKYTNSVESIEHHLQNGKLIFEVDVVKLKDSFGMAHNGKEREVYDLDREFGEITLNKFLELRAYNSYTPIDFCELNKIMNNNSNAKFILDIKEQDETYTEVLDHVISTVENTHNIIPQVYCVDDIKKCIECGFESCVIGFWKNYPDIFIEEANDLINYAQSLEQIQIMGFVVFFHHYYNESFEEFENKLNHPIYFHGQFAEPHILSDGEIHEFNKKGYYFFV